MNRFDTGLIPVEQLEAPFASFIGLAKRYKADQVLVTIIKDGETISTSMRSISSTNLTFLLTKNSIKWSKLNDVRP